MTGSASAYTILGLEPGAEPAAIDEAYRRLIKRYHPDRDGGDGGKAAEINRAYFELRRRLPAQPTWSSPSVARGDQPQRKRRRRPRRWRWAMPLLVLGGLVGASTEPGQAWVSAALGWLQEPRAPAQRGGRAGLLPSGSLEAPIASGEVAAAVRQAADLKQLGLDAALVDVSRSCHRQMRAEPDITRLDRCAAFDDAVQILNDSDSMHDRGPFAASAVTARQMNAAGLLSGDYMAIESRLNRIRTMVELRLVPPAPPPPPVPAPKEEAPGG